MKAKNSRLETLKMLISSQELSSQDQLLEALHKEGFKITQATLSRDLKLLKVAKAASSSGKYAYVLPNDTLYKRVSNHIPVSKMMVNTGFQSINFSGNMVVIKTRPGYASSIAYNIGGKQWKFGHCADRTVQIYFLRRYITMGKRIVIALGGNALGNTPYEQLALVTETAKPIVDLIAQGNEVIIAHGNGPQVGMINLGMATAAEAKAIKSDMPFPECGAMSQGYIGYHLQNAIGNELASRGMAKDVATVVTQVLVDEADPAFQHPTKPVGAFYDKETADRIAAEKGYTMVEDAGRGYRQVVPSPKPIDVIEKNTVKALVDNGTVVITVGGGGIPVVRRDGKLVGTPAVIDKDFASAKLAELLDADMLVILTAVEKVAINFGKPDQKGLDTLTPDEARKYIDEKQFAPGSMLPKVQAAMSFAESKPGRVALITLLEKAAEGIEGKTGTRVQM